MGKIKRVSLAFRILFQITFITLPIVLAFSWVYAPDEVVWLIGFVKAKAIPASYAHHILHTLSNTEKMWGFLLSSVPLAIELYILYALIKLFQLYEQGEIFSLNNVGYIRKIGYALLAGQFIQPFYQFLMGVVLTMNNPKGHRIAAITLDQTNVGIVLTGFMVILISWMMTEAYRLKEEQQLTV